MYKQYTYLRENVTMTRGQTFKIDLPETGFLSALLLKITAPAVSGLGLSGGAWRLLDFLGAVEVIANGATVIKSVDAKHLHFLSFLRQGIVPPHFWRNYATNTQMEYLAVLFGRKIGDEQYGLDLSMYDNVELRVTNSSSASYHGSDLSISIMQVFLRDVVGGFSGHIRSEKWREWTTVQDETQYFVLPTEYPISGLYLRALPATTNGMSDTGFANLMDDIDLSILGGTRQMFKGGLDDLIIANYLERGAEIITSGLADVTADKGIDVGVGRMFGWSGISGSKDGAVSSVIPTIIADATDNTISFEAREADSPVEFLVRGLAYQNMAWLLHNQELDPSKMLDPQTMNEIRLNLHTRNASSAASGTAQVLMERLVI